MLGGVFWGSALLASGPARLGPRSRRAPLACGVVWLETFTQKKKTAYMVLTFQL